MFNFIHTLGLDALRIIFRVIEYDWLVGMSWANRYAPKVNFLQQSFVVKFYSLTGLYEIKYFKVHILPKIIKEGT